MDGDRDNNLANSFETQDVPQKSRWAGLRIWGFTLSLSFVQLLNLLILTYFSANVNTIEKQFGLSSAKSGLIMSSEDVAYVLLVLLVTYLGEKGHKPRILGISSFCFSAASIMFVLPYIIYGPVEIAANMDNVGSLSSSMANATSPTTTNNGAVALCLPGESGDSEDFDPKKRPLGFRPVEFNSIAFGLLVVGFLLTGAGSTPINSLGLTYIDDSVKRTKSAFFMGIVNSVRILGPVLGFSLGAAFSKIPVDFKAKDYGIRDPRWVGAWWAGFAVTAAAGIIFGVPLMFFPRHMVKQTTEENEDEQSKYKLIETEQQEQSTRETKAPERKRPRRVLILTKETAKELPKLIGRLVRNPVYSCLAVSSCFDALMIGGFYSFLAKYLRIHFNVPFWKAGLVAGWCGAAASSLGCFIGGFVTSRWKMTPLTASKFATIAAVLSALLHGALTVVDCPQSPVAAVSGLQNVSRSKLISECVRDCACPRGEFLPVCGDNGVSYTSPCNAGCQVSYVRNGTKGGRKKKYIYKECGCVDGLTNEVNIGLCDGECQLTAYLIILLATSILVGLFSMPLCIVTLRCVRESDRSMALGLGSFLTNVLGFLPAPIITGLVVDSTCQLWSGRDGKGACSIYDKPKLRLYFHLLITGYKVLACVLKVVVVYMYTSGRVQQPIMGSQQNKREET